MLPPFVMFPPCPLADTLAFTDSDGRAYRLTNHARLFQSTLRLGIQDNVPRGGPHTHFDGAYTYFDCIFSSAPMGDVAPTSASIIGEFDYQYSPEAEEAITDYTTPDFSTTLNEGGDAFATALVTAPPSQADYNLAVHNSLRNAPVSADPTGLSPGPVTADAIHDSLDYQPSDLHAAFIEGDDFFTALTTAGPESRPSSSNVLVATYNAITGAIVSDLVITVFFTDLVTAPTDTTSTGAGPSLDQALELLDTAIDASEAPLSLLNTVLNEINSTPHSNTLVYLSTTLTTLQETLDNLKGIMDAKNATRPTPHSTLSSSLHHTLSDIHTTMFKVLTLLTIEAVSLKSGFSDPDSDPSARKAAHSASMSTLNGALSTLGNILALQPREMLGNFGSLDPALHKTSAVLKCESCLCPSCVGLSSV